MLESMNVDLPGLFEKALERFAADEADLIYAGVSERSLCARLAIALEGHAHDLGLTDYRADVEYNRNGVDTLKGYYRREYHDFVRITCDIILHARGRWTPDNLIAIEMKRDEHPGWTKDSDRERLIALTLPDQRFEDEKGREIKHVSGYQFGYLLQVVSRKEFQVEEYAGGTLQRYWTAKF